MSLFDLVELIPLLFVMIELDHRSIGRSHPWWLSGIVGLLRRLLSSLFVLVSGRRQFLMPAVFST
jgi:hypothetical protein